MQVWENTGCEPFVDFNFRADPLDVEVIQANKGLRVMSVGEQSPFCRLRTKSYFKMQGLVERDDCIVAVDGVLLREANDLLKLVHQRKCCEVSIFDHRTRLTLSWQIQFDGMKTA